MNNTNLKSAGNWQLLELDPAVKSMSKGGAVADLPQRTSHAHRDQAARIVLLIGLFGLAWVILMRDVRVSLPAQVTSTPRVAAQAAEGSDSGIPEAGSPQRSVGSDGP